MSGFEEYPHSHESNMRDELARLLLLQSYATVHEDTECLDRLTRMVARVFHVNMCFLNLIDCCRSGVIACSNKDRNREMSPCPCRGTICAYAMHRCRQNEAFTVEDASKDERFQNLDIVKSKTIMFYAAVPISLEGFTIGVLCLVDSNPRKFTEREKVTLNDFAFTAVQCLARLRRGTGCTQQKQQNIAHITHDLMTPLTGLQLSLSLLESDNNLQGNLKVRETLKDVYCCCDILKEIYHESLESLGSLQHALPATKHVTKTDELVHSISKVASTIPKGVPLIIEIDKTSPSCLEKECCKIVFRAALNLISIATTRTKVGFVRLQISGCLQNHIKFQCIDCADNVDKDDSMKLFVSMHPNNFHDDSLANYYYPAKILSKLRGSDHGFLPRNGVSGSIFWFSVPCQSERMNTNTSSSGDPPALIEEQDSFFYAELMTAKRQRRLLNELQNDIFKVRTALVVDDSIVIRKNLGRSLSLLGFDVEVAENGLEGLEKLKKGPFDLVLCDFLMPVLDGLDCVRQFREWEVKNRPNRHQYIVGISAHASMHDFQIGMECGMDHYLSKPITVEALKNLPIDTNHSTTKMTLPCMPT